ncbi:hypothetical protein [Bacillus safensis]
MVGVGKDPKTGKRKQKKKTDSEQKKRLK